MFEYDILLQNGQVMDPARNINEITTIGVKDGRIVPVKDNGDGGTARVTLDLTGKIITPGLVDLHCHPAGGFIESGVDEAHIGLFSGVTLLCDAGSAGAYNFDAFRKFVVEPAQTDILCFLNLANTGLSKLPEICSPYDMDPAHSLEIIQANRDLIRGVKLRLVEAFVNSVGIEGVEQAKELCARANLPLMLHIGETRPRRPKEFMDDFTRAAVSLLDEGDIISHFLTWEPGGLILKDGTVYPELLAAGDRGVVLDACHGLNHFSFAVAKKAMEHGISPTVLSTDLCTMVMPSAQSLAVVMSKFLCLGFPLEEVIAMTTANPARAAGAESSHGSLEPGRRADLTVLELLEGDFTYTDGNGGEKIRGNLLLEPRMTIHSGEMTPAFSRYHTAPPFSGGK